MEAIIHLTNGMRANTEDIKCPFCGSKMKLRQYSKDAPESFLFKESMLHPFCEIVMKQKTIYESVFECKNGCCELNVRHEVESLILP